MKRTPRYYDGNLPTGKKLKDLSSNILFELKANSQSKIFLLLREWPEIVGRKISLYTKAESFVGGVLTVHVKNSTLLSLLAEHEKYSLIKKLKQKFPEITIKDIYFKIGY